MTKTEILTAFVTQVLHGLGPVDSVTSVKTLEFPATGRVVELSVEQVFGYSPDSGFNTNGQGGKAAVIYSGSDKGFYAQTAKGWYRWDGTRWVS